MMKSSRWWTCPSVWIQVSLWVKSETLVLVLVLSEVKSSSPPAPVSRTEPGGPLRITAAVGLISMREVRKFISEFWCCRIRTEPDETPGVYSSRTSGLSVTVSYVFDLLLIETRLLAEHSVFKDPTNTTLHLSNALWEFGLGPTRRRFTVNLLLLCCE